MLGIKKSKRDLISRFKKSSIFMSNLKRFTVIIAIPLIILNLLTAMYYYRSISLESRMTSTQIYSMAQGKMESAYEETEKIFLSLILEPGLESIMDADSFYSLNEYQIKHVNELSDLAEKYTTSSNIIDAIYVYSYNAGYVLSTTGNSESGNFKSFPWMEVSSDDYCFTIKNKNSVSICYNLTSPKEKRGLVVFDINSTELKSGITDYSGRNVYMQISSNRGDVLYRSGTPSFEPEITSKQHSFHMHNKYTEIASGIYDILLYIAVDHPQPIYSNFIFISILFIFAVVILSGVFAFILASYSYRAVQDIIKNVNDIEPLDEFSTAANEINYINQNILSIKSKNEKLEEELLTSFANLKALQMQVLQSQFTPHFLFNTLNVVSVELMLKNGVNNPESKSLTVLSELLSESIDTKNYMVPMKDELEYCNKYITIQSYISNNNFDVVMNIEKSSRECMYIKFTLQPLIENAFKHGIKYLKNKKRGLLSISTKREKDNLVVTIKNNGPVPEEAELTQLNRMLSEGVGYEKNHVGLFNVNKRVKLVFGEDYGCRIFCEDDTTTVTVTTPFITDISPDTL